MDTLEVFPGTHQCRTIIVKFLAHGKTGSLLMGFEPIRIAFLR
jgi:hypothetical protein